MITKNEEVFLDQCLNSVKGLVDEIVIVDTGSTDATKKIARKFTDKIFNLTWCDDFSAARNESLKHATGDWILVLDADETISEKDFPKIESLVAHRNILGYALAQRNYTNNTARSSFIFNADDDYNESKEFLGRVESWIVRLFQNHADIRFSGKVHELVEPSIKLRGGKYERAHVPIHHFAEAKGKERLRNKLELYHNLCKKKVADEPKNAQAHLELGTQYKELGKFAEAEEKFKISLNLNPEKISPVLNLAIVQHKQGKFDQAIANYKKVLERNAQLADAYFGLGFCHFKKNDLEKSEYNFRKATEKNPDFLDAYINMGAICEKQGKMERAMESYGKALKIHPKNARLYNNLGVVHEKTGNLQMAVECYRKAIALKYSRKDELKYRIEKIDRFLKERRAKKSATN